jgi:hypothetical protein
LAAAEIGLKEHDRLALAKKKFWSGSWMGAEVFKTAGTGRAGDGKPLVSAGMVAKTLGVTSQAARRIVGAGAARDDRAGEVSGVAGDLMSPPCWSIRNLTGKDRLWAAIRGYLRTAATGAIGNCEELLADWRGARQDPALAP